MDTSTAVLLVALVSLVYILTQAVEQDKSDDSEVVYVPGPIVGPAWGQGPLWRGPIPGGRRWRRRRRRRFWF